MERSVSGIGGAEDGIVGIEKVLNVIQVDQAIRINSVLRMPQQDRYIIKSRRSASCSLSQQPRYLSSQRHACRHSTSPSATGPTIPGTATPPTHATGPALRWPVRDPP